MKSKKNVFTFIDEMRDNPTRFLREDSLFEIESLIWGYCSALSMHGIVESVPAMDRHFLCWLRFHLNIKAHFGFAEMIKSNLGKGDESYMDGFFRFTGEYRKLKPECLFRIKLKAKHQPQGRGGQTGPDPMIEKPEEIAIYRYMPSPLHFPRYYYPDRVENGPILSDTQFDYETTVDYAKSWLFKEFLIEPIEWEEK